MKVSFALLTSVNLDCAFISVLLKQLSHAGHPIKFPPGDDFQAGLSILLHYQTIESI